MNIEFLKALAQRLESLPPEKFDMNVWQYGESIATTEQGFHACGNTACIAGYAALMPEWTANGGRLPQSVTGLPEAGHAQGAWAFAKVADLNIQLSVALVTQFPAQPNTKVDHDLLEIYANIQVETRSPEPAVAVATLQMTMEEIAGKPWADWKAKDAAAVINHLISLHHG